MSHKYPTFTKNVTLFALEKERSVLNKRIKNIQVTQGFITAFNTFST